jgi:hypothetical protein
MRSIFATDFRLCLLEAAVGSELANVLLQTQNSQGELQSHVFPTVVTDRTRKRDFERAGIPEAR